MTARNLLVRRWMTSVSSGSSTRRDTKRLPPGRKVSPMQGGGEHRSPPPSCIYSIVVGMWPVRWGGCPAGNRRDCHVHTASIAHQTKNCQSCPGRLSADATRYACARLAENGMMKALVILRSQPPSRDAEPTTSAAHDCLQEQPGIASKPSGKSGARGGEKQRKQRDYSEPPNPSGR
jgi:hypothetical protein